MCLIIKTSVHLSCAACSVFLVDHAWTYRMDYAREQLEQTPGLLPRMAALMGVDFHGEVPDEHTVELVMERMWKYNQTYHLGLGVRHDVCNPADAVSLCRRLCPSSCVTLLLSCAVCRTEGSCVVHHGWVRLPGAALRSAQLWHGPLLLHSRPAGLLCAVASAGPAGRRWTHTHIWQQVSFQMMWVITVWQWSWETLGSLKVSRAIWKCLLKLSWCLLFSLGEDCPFLMMSNWLRVTFMKVSKHAPLYKFRIKGWDNPWFTAELAGVLHERNSAWARARKSGLEADWLYFRQLQNKFTPLLRNTKAEFYLSMTTQGPSPLT